MSLRHPIEQQRQAMKLSPGGYISNEVDKNTEVYHWSNSNS